MKPLFYIFILAIVLLVNPGCATPYKPADSRDGCGYYGGHKYGNVYTVEYRANCWTDEQTVEQYFLRRANELCQTLGYQEYRILSGGSIVYSNCRNVRTTECIYPADGRVREGESFTPVLEGSVECLEKSK